MFNLTSCSLKPVNFSERLPDDGGEALKLRVAGQIALDIEQRIAHGREIDANLASPPMRTLENLEHDANLKRELKL